MLTTDAFIDSPSYTEIFRGDKENRRRMLLFFFHCNLSIIHRKTPDALRYFSYDNSSELDCFYMLIHNSDVTISTWEKVFGGILDLPFLAGFGAVQRMINVGQFVDRIEEEVMATYGCERYLVLQRVVVNPAIQGKGFGSNCLAKGLAEADELKLPICLSTQLMRNVTFYSRL